jgi:hypothetical protein
MNKILSVIAVGLALVALVVAVARETPVVVEKQPNEDPALGAIPPQGNFDAITVEEFEQGGGAYQLSFTGTGSTTLTQDLMANNNWFVIPASTTFPIQFTVTLPATSTLTSILTEPGDTREWYFQNENTVAATTTTIAAGTGINLVGDTANDDLINGAEIGRLTCIRDRISTTARPGDVYCWVSESVAAD